MIIADYRLQEDRDGILAINRVNGLFDTDVPALVVTGDTAPDRLQLLRASGYPILHKPVGSRVLQQALQRTLSPLPAE